MIYKGGKKHFMIIRSVPKSMIYGHITELREIFNSLYVSVIPYTSKTDVKYKTYARGRRLAFTVAFGLRRYNPDILESIIKKIVDASLLTLASRNNQASADKKMEGLKEEYAEYRRNKPKIEI